MSDARELVLEQALRTVFDAPLADASARVLERWRTDAGASAVDARSRGARSFPWLASSVLAVGAALVVFLLARPHSESAGPLAASDLPVTASEPGEWRPVATTLPKARETVGAEQAVALTLVGGARLELAAGSVIRLEPAGDVAVGSVPAVRLLAGDATLTCSSVSLLLVGDARVALAPDACVHAQTLGFHDPYVIPPTTRPFLARNLHMNRIAPAAAALFTLLSGSAVLTDASGSRPLPADTAVASSAQELTDPVRDLLAREVGTWDLVITDHRDGKALPSYTGTEVCSLPSTGEWLLSDMTSGRIGKPPVWVHVVLGYQPGLRRFGGSLVDSFGGEMALLAGDAGEEPTVRVLSQLRVNGESFGTRSVMRWVSDDERITLLEEEIDGEWVLIREIVHRRKVDADKK